MRLEWVPNHRKAKAQKPGIGSESREPPEAQLQRLCRQNPFEAAVVQAPAPTLMGT